MIITKFPNKIVVDVPNVTIGDYIYNGSTQGPGNSTSNINSQFVQASNGTAKNVKINSKGILPYTYTLSLKNPQIMQWSDGSTDPKTYDYRINQCYFTYKVRKTWTNTGSFSSGDEIVDYQVYDISPSWYDDTFDVVCLSKNGQSASNVIGATYNKNSKTIIVTYKGNTGTGVLYVLPHGNNFTYLVASIPVQVSRTYSSGVSTGGDASPSVASIVLLSPAQGGVDITSQSASRSGTNVTLSRATMVLSANKVKSQALFRFAYRMTSSTSLSVPVYQNGSVVAYFNTGASPWTLYSDRALSPGTYTIGSFSYTTDT